MTPKEAKDPRELVFEIGTEELPATNLADLFETAASENAENALLEKWKAAFRDNRIAFGSANVWATPRRLVFYLSGVVTAQEKRDQLTRLLAKQEAYGADGKATEKFLAILKHRNVSEADTTVSDWNGKPFVFLRKAETVRKTASVLPELLEAFARSLSFPKNMKWDDSGVVFPRPIRHTLCFYGSESVKYKIGRARSSDRVWFFSRGKRWSVPAGDAASYFRALKKNGVILDPAERKEAIRAMLEKLARAHQGRLYDDPFLLAEVNFLVEHPETLAAPFHEEFLQLPLEVLTVSMARKQRIFGLVDKDGRVLPRFLAIMDGAATPSEKKSISQNYENILHAKLQDSLFFFNEDSKIALEKRREELKSLIFLKGAGSMLERSERLEKMAERFGRSVLPEEETRQLKRAARLSKCDLLTQMVGEFPELQGIIGKYYAARSGESPATALAIGEHYLPRTVSDRLPEGRLGSLLSIFDKLDLICACFALGLQPTSSMDPYGLRRSASAIFKIVIREKLSLDVPSLLDHALELLEARVQNPDKRALRSKLTLFLQDRFRSVLVDQGRPADLVDAVLALGLQDVQASCDRVAVLAKSAEKPSFLQAVKIIERTSNILKGSKEDLPEKPDPALFTESLEHALFAKFQQAEPEIRQAKTVNDLARATSLYAEAFFDILNEFFDKVFINAEDPNVRKNRLSLLKAIKELYTRDIADLSRIQNQEKR